MRKRIFPGRGCHSQLASTWDPRRPVALMAAHCHVSVAMGWGKGYCCVNATECWLRSPAGMGASPMATSSPHHRHISAMATSSTRVLRYFVFGERSGRWQESPSGTSRMPLLSAGSFASAAPHLRCSAPAGARRMLSCTHMPVNPLWARQPKKKTQKNLGRPHSGGPGSQPEPGGRTDGGLARKNTQPQGSRERHTATSTAAAPRLGVSLAATWPTAMREGLHTKGVPSCVSQAMVHSHQARRLRVPVSTASACIWLDATPSGGAPTQGDDAISSA